MRSIAAGLFILLITSLLPSPPLHGGEELSRKEKMVNYSFLGRIYVKMGDTPKAISAYENALTLIPTNLEVRAQLARLYQTAGLNSEAIEEYKKLIEINPGNISYHLNLARVYEKTGDDEGVIKECRTVLSTSTNDRELASARSLLIEAISRLGRIEQLIPEIKNAIEAKPNKIGNYLFLAKVYHKNNQPELMLDIYRKTLSLFPQNTDLIWEVANTLIKQKNYQEAIPILEELVKLTPGNSTYCYSLGRCYFESGEPDPQKAIALWDAFQAENSNIEPYFYYTTGCMYRNYKLYDRSLEQLQKSYRLSNDPIRSLSAIAQTYEDMGDDENATATYMRVMMDSDSEYWVDRAQDGLIRIYQRRKELEKLAILIEGILNNDQKGGSDEENE